MGRTKEELIMTEEMKQLKEWIEAAKDGHEGAINVLRHIISAASAKAPDSAIIEISEFLYELRKNDELHSDSN